MKLQPFLLKDIQSNPFRNLKRYPIQEARVKSAMESISSKGGWIEGSLVARIGAKGLPEVAFGHHRLEALKRLGWKELRLGIEPMSDAVMIQRMARENKRVGDDSKLTAAFYREMILATLHALADGNITAEEISIATDQGKRTDAIRIAPGFETRKYAASGILPSGAYTVDALAKFLGAVDDGNDHATEDFKAAFSALELIEEGTIKEKDIEQHELYTLGPVITLYKTQRDARRKEELAEKEARQKALESLERKQLQEAEKKATEESRRKAQENIDKAAEHVKKLDAASEKATAQSLGELKGVVTDLIGKVKDMPRREIREVTKNLAEELEHSRKQNTEVARASVKPEKQIFKEKAFDDFLKSVDETQAQHKKHGSALTHKVLRDADLMKMANRIVTVGMREISKTAHPDKGGSQNEMQLLNAATTWLKSKITEKEKLNEALSK